jgi:hypothetical protein
MTSAQTTTTMPAGLVTVTVQESSRFIRSVVSAGVQSTRAVGLARGVSYAMMISKLKTPAIALLACALTLGGLKALARQFGSDRGTTEGVPSASAANPRTSTVLAEPAVDKRTITVRVVDPDGMPIQGALVFRNHVYKPHGRDRDEIENQEYLTNVEGKAVVSLSDTSVDLRLWVRKAGFTPLHAMWAKQFQSDGDIIPKEFVFPLKRGTEIGGVVVDQRGEPIKGVRVEVKDRTAMRPIRPNEANEAGERPVGAYSLAEGTDAVVTDTFGRWKLGNVPPDEALVFHLFRGVPEPPLKIELRLSHPDYVSGEIGWGELQIQQGITLKALREKTAKIMLLKK